MSEALFAAVDALQATIAGLQARVSVLEKRKALTFAGLWERGRSYHEGDAVNYMGSIWIAQAGTTTAEPDAGSNAWALGARAGRDTR